MYRLIHLRSLSKNNFKVLTSSKGSEAWTNNKFSRKSFTLTKNFNLEEFPLRINGKLIGFNYFLIILFIKFNFNEIAT